MNKIPRRPLIPILTDLLEYRQAAANTIPYTRKMIAKYGDVCEVSFTGIKNYFIHDPEVIKEILSTQSPKFKRTYLFRAFRKFLGNGLFTSDADYHKRQRRLIKPAFYPERINEYAGIMIACAEDEMRSWKEGEELNIKQAMTRITLNVITKSMFGSGMQAAEIAEVGQDLKTAFDLMNRILLNPVYVYCLEKGIQIPLVRRFFAIKARLDKIVNKIIAAGRTDTTTGKKDLLSMLMEAKDEETGEAMTDEQIRDEVMTFFIAGHETTTIALTWTWYLLGRHPEIADEFYDEVRSVAEKGNIIASDYEKLTFTRNVFKESLRLYPPAWTFAREPTEDVIIQGYHFPKGCVLWTITYLIHRSGKYYYAPEEFIPSRWNNEEMKTLPRYAYSPFGGGNRMCIGEGFARMEGVLVLATIASKFKLKLDKDFTTTIDPLFTLKPKNAIMMTCSAHS